MTVVNRYFRATPKSPFALRVKQIVKDRIDNSKVLLGFMKEIGATQMFGNTPKTYMFDFSKGDHDPKVWKKKKLGRGGWSMVPRLNTPEGKAMMESINQLPSLPQIDDAMITVPGIGGNHVVFSDMAIHHPFTRYYHLKKNIFIISIPFGGLDKPTKQYIPPPWLKEMKEWEVLKLIEESA